MGRHSLPGASLVLALVSGVTACSNGPPATTTSTTTTTTTTTTNTTTATNTASPISFVKVVLSTEFLTEGAAIADFDHDGHPDVVAGPYIYAGPEFKNRIAIREVTKFDPKYYSNDFFSFPYDFDGDGWVDVLK